MNMHLFMLQWLSLYAYSCVRPFFTHHAYYFHWLNLQDYKKNEYMEAEMQCSNASKSMERTLRAACNATNAKFDNVVKVLDGLVSEYEKSSHGPGKWQKLAMLLQKKGLQ
ncbi:uncharacterized protein LOC133784431 [Humulus lupulus]|uniref:uncharacterized protein LOC133784431 n=1 Tax=Humulus lupulus TaxID=3486 RepID=UPI002B414C99|nr:uncharacterized protein LOC133784431 [Humulus lupulus]